MWPGTTFLERGAVMIEILAQKWSMGKGRSLLEKWKVDWVVAHKMGQEKRFRAGTKRETLWGWSNGVVPRIDQTGETSKEHTSSNGGEESRRG